MREAEVLPKRKRHPALGSFTNALRLSASFSMAESVAPDPSYMEKTFAVISGLVCTWRNVALAAWVVFFGWEKEP